MDCYGAGKVHKLAEIVAATVLCGETVLGSAVVADEWVAAHDVRPQPRRPRTAPSDAAPERTRARLMWLRHTAPLPCTLMLGQRAPLGLGPAGRAKRPA